MSEVNHADRAHSALGASSASRWMACPASIPLSEGIKDTTSEAAEEGTAAHEICEMMLKGEELPESLNGFNVDEEMIAHCQVYVDYVQENAKDAEVYIEERVDLSHIDDSMFGTNDAAIVKPFDSIEIIDFKYGKGISVEAVNNQQLLYYALGMAKDADVSKVKMTVVQPRADHKDGPIRSWEISYKVLMKWEEILKKAVSDVHEAQVYAKRHGFNEQFYANAAESGSHCRFCKAAGFCEKLRDESLAVAKTEFSDVVEDKVILPDPKDLSPKELGKILEASTMLSIWFKQVEGYSKTLADQGTKIEGYKLVKKRANRKWESEAKVIEEFSDMFGDSIYEKKLLSPAKIEKLVGKEEVKKLTITPDSGTSLVPSKDKRKEVSPQIESDFTNI